MCFLPRKSSRISNTSAANEQPLQPGRHPYRFHPDGPRWAGHQPARGWILRLRLSHAQARRHCQHCARLPLSSAPRHTTSASKATPTTSRFTTPSSIPTGSSRPPAQRSIARLLLDLNAIPPDRISAAGYAEFHPVATNDNPEGRAQNRRVDLVVLPRTKINFSQPESSSSWHVAKNHRRTITPFRLHNPVVSIDSRPSA